MITSSVTEMPNDYRLRALGPSGWGNPQSFQTAETVDMLLKA